MERQAESDPSRKEVLYDQSDSQEEVSSKEETTELEIMSDLISVATEVETTRPINIASTTETETSDLAAEPNERVTCEVIKSPVTEGGEKLYTTCDTSKVVPENVLAKEKPELIIQSKLEVCETAGCPDPTDVKSVELKNIVIISDIKLNVDQKVTLYPVTEHISTLVLESSKTRCSNELEQIPNVTSEEHKDPFKKDPTIKLDDSDVEMQTSVITIDDTFEESLKQLQGTEELLSSTTIITSPKKNLTTENVTNRSKHAKNTEDLVNNTIIIIESPENKFVDETSTSHVGQVDNSDSNLTSTKEEEASQDCVVVNTKECLKDNAHETSKTNLLLSPQCGNSNETFNMKPNVESSSRITETDTSNVFIIIDDDSLIESSIVDCINYVADLDKTSPVISVESSDAEQDIELSESENIHPISQESANTNETFVSCRPSVVSDESLEYTNSKVVITKQTLFDPGETVSTESIVPRITVEDLTTCSPGSLNLTENLLVAALEALNINCDEKDDTFLSCQENFELSNVENSSSFKGSKAVDENRAYTEIAKSDLCETSEEGNIEEASATEIVQFPKSNVGQDSVDSDTNSSCETVILKEKPSFPAEAADISFTKSSMSCPQTISSQINNEANLEEDPKTGVRSAESVMESARNTSCYEVLTMKFVPSNSPLASSSPMLKNEANVEEAPIIASPDSFVEQENIKSTENSHKTLKAKNVEEDSKTVPIPESSNEQVVTEISRNRSCFEVTFEDNKMNISTEAGDVLTTKFVASKSPQAGSSSILENEAPRIGSPESSTEQDAIKRIKNTSYQTITLEDQVEEVSKTVALSPESNIEPGIRENTKDTSCSEVTLVAISTEAGDVSSINFDLSKSSQVSNSSMSKNEANVEETTRTGSPEFTIENNNQNTYCGNITEEYNKVDLYAEADVSVAKFGPSNSPQASSSMILKKQANASENRRITIDLPVCSIEENTTPESTKNASSETVTLDDNKIDLSPESDNVSSTKSDASNSLQCSSFSVSKDEADVEESSSGQNTTEADSDKSNLSTETEDISPLQSFSCANASISSCDTPERSLLSYSSLMEASPSLFAQQVTRYEKQSHLKLRINELEQSLAKLKLQLRQKEAVIMNLQIENINAIKENEKLSKVPVPFDIATVKKLQKYEKELDKAKLKIAELEKWENEKSLLETKIKAQEQDYLALEKKYEEIALQLKTYEQKNFDMILEVERAYREKKKALETMERYEALLLEFTASKNNLKGCLEEVMLKYERAKIVICGLKSNEDAYKKQIDQLQDQLKTFSEKYEILKLQALAQIEEANKENFKLSQQLHQEKKAKKPAGKK